MSNTYEPFYEILQSKEEIDRIAENIENVQSQCGDLCKNINEQNDEASEKILKMINDFESKITSSDKSNHDRVMKFTQNIKLSITGETLSTYSEY